MNTEQLLDKLTAYITDEPPVKIEQGSVIREGVCAELDEWKDIAKNGQQWIAEYQQNLIEETGINTLKIKFNKVFGYFIEISKGQAADAPEYFMRKQTLTNCERFTTEELIQYQEKVLKAEEEIVRMENEIFQELCKDTIDCAQDLQKLADELSEIDVLSAFGDLAVENKYCKPEITEENTLHIEEGRHPVVEELTDNFISNECHFDQSTRFQLLTGPNMAGKSTYLRQNALIIYLSHVGCFTPAAKATIGLTDRIFTRVGAGDNLASGESTFMMEMIEAATILHNATDRSFLILDELGRGTSTFDGLSLAWAMSEDIHERIQAKCIFATHYHEMVEAVNQMKQAKNSSIAVIENESQGVVFLHKIVDGGADRSYGIEVARLAGVPKNILTRAGAILSALEEKKEKQEQALQMDLFNFQETPKEKIVEVVKESEVEKQLKNLDLNNLTPLQALNTLEALKKEI